jgi:hypothetical protein
MRLDCVEAFSSLGIIMNQLLAGVVACVILTSLVGCVSTPTTPSAAQSVPADRVYYSKRATSNLPAKVVIIKDKGTWASFGYHQLFIDGKVAASLGTGERVELDLDPSDYVLGVLPVAFASTQEQSLTGYAVTSIDQTLNAGKTYYYRVLVDGDNSSRIQRFVPD